MITNQVKACIVNAIEQGLIITQESIKDRSRRFNNSKNFQKIDEIMDQVAISLGNDYKAIKFERGNYELLLIYDDSEKILYSLFSNSNIKKLLHRKSRKKIHYADGFVAINANENRQLTLFEDENNIRYLQIEK